MYTNGVVANSASEEMAVNELYWSEILPQLDSRGNARRGSSACRRRPRSQPSKSSWNAESPSAPENEGRARLRTSPAVAGIPHRDRDLRHVGYAYLQHVGATRRPDGSADESGRQ